MATRQSFAGSNSSRVKQHNVQAILLALLRHAYVSRVQLANLTGLSTTTITNLVAELLEQGIVVEEGSSRLKRQPGAGRPRQALRLVPEARYAVGVHIGVGDVRSAVTDLRAKIIRQRAVAHPPDQPASLVLDKTIKLVEQIITDDKIPLSKIIGLGVGASGLVDPAGGVNLLAPNLNWRDVPIRDRLAKRLGLPTCIDNNVRAMALGEALFGAATTARVVAFVYGRIGVGAGFVVDGRLFHGSGAGAGEIGHTTIIARGGQVCRCGNTGCLETLVSEPVIMEQAETLAARDKQGLLAQYLQAVVKPTIEQVFAAARAGDVPTQMMLTEHARYLGIALANLVNILNPELILLGGIFAQGHDLFLPPVQETIRERAFSDPGRSVRLQPTGFGRNAGVIGAAALALTNFFYQPTGAYTPYQLSEVTP